MYNYLKTRKIFCGKDKTKYLCKLKAPGGFKFQVSSENRKNNKVYGIQF